MCDLDDGEHRSAPSVSRLVIVFDGESRRVDLCAEHAAQARLVIQDLIGDAQAGSRGGRVPGSRRDLSEHRAQIRQWAAENGYGVSGRGRLSVTVMHAYAQSHRGVTM